MALVRIVKNWDFPDLLRQTPHELGEWEGITFTLDPVEECDYLIFLNNQMEEAIRAKCPVENVWAIMQEPYMKGHTDWMAEKHDHFAKVFTHSPPSHDPKYIPSHPALPWHVNKTYDQLLSMPIPDKTRPISWVVGNANDLPGHFKRLSFLRCIQQDKSIDIDLFGRAVVPIEDKWDGLAPYKYSLAIENTSTADYWTEKIADCFLSWTVPIYFGCNNIADYFPPESYIIIDINNRQKALEKVKKMIAEDQWEKRLPALQEARNLVLNRYQLFPFLAELIKAAPATTEEKTRVTIPPYKKSLKASLYGLRYKIVKKINTFSFN